MKIKISETVCGGQLRIFFRVSWLCYVLFVGKKYWHLLFFVKFENGVTACLLTFDRSLLKTTFSRSVDVEGERGFSPARQKNCLNEGVYSSEK